MSVVRHTIICLISLLALAAQASDLRSSVERYVTSTQQALVTELVSLLSIPNVATDTANIRKNAVFLRDMLARRGLDAEILETDGNPLVYGQLRVPGAQRTMLMYAHYDGQPVDAKQWKQESPFLPVLRGGRLEDGAPRLLLRNMKRFDPNWRLYARSASDDKSPIVALCAALDALKAAGRQPTSHIKVILDGEEEAGSRSLVPAIGRYREKLSADVMLILDGPVHPSGRPTLVFGARGNLAIELTVYGPKFGLHSGHYGNWIPNPAMRLAQLLATMKDDNGRVLIDGFYDGLVPLPPDEQSVLAGVPDDELGLLKFFGVAAPEQKGLSLQQALQRPSLNVRGLSSAFVGPDARTIIPDRAVAAIDIRLVKETPAKLMLAKMRAHLQKQGYHVIDEEPDDETRERYGRIVRLTSRGGTNAYRTSPLDPHGKHLADAIAKVWGQPAVRIRTSGGTVPISPFIEALGFPAISVPIVNFDNHQHDENENVRLGHFFAGIVTIAAVLTM